MPGQDSHRCMMHLLLSVLQTIFLIRSLYVKSQSIASTSNTTFWWALQTQTEWVIFEPARTHHLGLKAQSFENPIFTFWKQYIILASYKTLQVGKFLLMYSFTHTNIVFLSRHLPTEIVILINVCYQMKCFSGEVQTRYSKTSKYSQKYIRDHLSGTKVSIWICSE